jgi:hypothetical protein
MLFYVNHTNGVRVQIKNVKMKVRQMEELATETTVKKIAKLLHFHSHLEVNI